MFGILAVTRNGILISFAGSAFHHNTSSPYLAVHQEIIFKGRPSNNMFYLRTQIVDNAWGGILVGNFCIPIWRNIQPKVLISWSELVGNRYHASIEVFSCQSDGMAITVIDITGNRVEGGLGIGFRMEPAVNTIATITSNQFIANNETALLIRNVRHPQLFRLPAQVCLCSAKICRMQAYFHRLHFSLFKKWK
ncbi:unnamed protein product [Gongylonema pulchrum]|uniref:DOMON domain-containing protein n=1 Tax=Gongylonema pulchrum TaxID=637853 RepID=A0A183DF16_9BILA|nr:unnamed protein product [Gongylonema pulchrum]